VSGPNRRMVLECGGYATAFESAEPPGSNAVGLNLLGFSQIMAVLNHTADCG